MKFSIVIPVYNAHDCLRPCLDSVVGQTERDWECICIDDGSKDDSGAICEEYSRRDSRFRVVRQQNKGLTATRNVGLRMARGEYVAFLDCDDARYGDWLELADGAIRRTGADMIRFGYADWHGEAYPARCCGGTPDIALREGEDDVLKWGFKNLSKTAYIWLSLYRRSRLDGFQFEERRIYREDIVSSMHIIRRMRSIAEVACRPCLYLIREGSMMHAKIKAEELIGYWEEYERILADRKDQIERIGLAKEVADNFAMMVYGGTRNWLYWQDGRDRDKWPKVAEKLNLYWKQGRLQTRQISGLWGVVFALYCRNGYRTPMLCLERLAVFANSVKKRFAGKG